VGPSLHANYLNNPRPEYPSTARNMSWEGKVILKVHVIANGSVGGVSVAHSSGHEILDEAAMKAVRQWKFVPAKRDGVAVESHVHVPINFNLKSE
jgi:protein TonB